VPVDFFIRGGTIVDGSGRTAFQGDIAVDEGRILAVGGSERYSSRRTIDATGLVIAPGFIDIHTHYDAQVLWDPLLGSSSQYGITTVVMGNCGIGVAPLRPEGAGYLTGLLANVEGMPSHALETGLAWDWSSYGQYLDRVDGELGPNVISLVGHSPLRHCVMGDAAYERVATDDERTQMQSVLEDALGAGGWGFSSSAAGTHNDLQGRPAPSRLADLPEFEILADVVGTFPFGIIGLSPESKLRGLTPEDQALLAMLSTRGGASVNWNPMVHTSSLPDLWRVNLSASAKAARQGARVFAVWNPSSTGGTRVDLKTCFLFLALPHWRLLAGKSIDEKMRIFADPTARRELAADLEHDTSMGALTARLRTMWDILRITEVFSSENEAYVGSTVGDVARKSNRTPLDAMLDIAIADHLDTVLMQDDIRDEGPEAKEAFAALVASPFVLFGGSDAGAHVDMLANESLSARTLEWRVHEEGSLSLEEVVRRFTSGIADAIGLRGRGRISAGYAADLMVFDLGQIGAGAAHVVEDLPGGCARLATEARGVSYVMVNGSLVFEHGTPTGNLPGRLLRSGRDVR
jgi:N-acyl-D-aspartate/D-glutamate deacylase